MKKLFLYIGLALFIGAFASSIGVAQESKEEKIEKLQREIKELKKEAGKETISEFSLCEQAKSDARQYVKTPGCLSIKLWDPVIDIEPSSLRLVDLSERHKAIYTQCYKEEAKKKINTYRRNNYIKGGIGVICLCVLIVLIESDE